jgi:lantibiotic modifying enzyme
MQYGFAHGVAGIGYFLLLAGIVTRCRRYTEIAMAAGDTLVRAAEPCPTGARWRSDIQSDGARNPSFYYYLCNGSAGVGAFLVRLWRVTGRETYRVAAQNAASAAYGVRWQSGMSTCCGLAGCGQLLLDMAEFVDEKYANWAHDLASSFIMRTIVRDDLALVADMPNGGVTIDYNTGLTGILDFLERLKSRAPRPWMVDRLLASSAVTLPELRR